MVPTIFGSQQLHYLLVIKQMLVQALGSPTKEVLLLSKLPVAMETIPQVWMAAIKAMVAFVMQIEDNNIRGHFLDALPLLLEVSGCVFVTLVVNVANLIYHSVVHIVHTVCVCVSARVCEGCYFSYHGYHGSLVLLFL